jgi:hypothetical protein
MIRRKMFSLALIASLAASLVATPVSAQLFKLHGTGTGDYKTISSTPVSVLSGQAVVPVGALARADVSGSFLWYVVPRGWCDGYVSLAVDGVDYSYVGLTNSPRGGTNDKPFALFALQEGDGLKHTFDVRFWTNSPGCEVGIENTGRTNLVMAISF